MPDPYADLDTGTQGTPLEGTPLQGTPLKSLPSKPIGSRRSPFSKTNNYSRKAATPAEKKLEGTLQLQGPDDEFTAVPLAEGGLDAFMKAVDEETGVPGYAEMQYQGGTAYGALGSMGFVPEGETAGYLPGGMRVSQEAFSQALEPEERMQYFEGTIPPEPEDIDRFQWESETDEGRARRTIAMQGATPEGDQWDNLGIPEFMPGVDAKPKFGTQSGLETMDSRHAFLGLLERTSRPFEAFSEAAFRTGKSVLWDSDPLRGEFTYDNSIVDLITNPNQFVDEESEYIKAFRERPMWAQLLLSIIDPTILFPGAKVSRVASSLIRAVSPDDVIKIMAKRGIAPFTDYQMVASGRPDAFVQNVLFNPEQVRPAAGPLRLEAMPPVRREFGTNVTWTAPWIDETTDLAYKEGIPLEGPAAPWPRIQDPSDLDYRHVDHNLIKEGLRQVIVVSAEYPNGRRLTIAAGKAAEEAVSEALGKTSDSFSVLEGTASRKEVLDAAGVLNLTDETPFMAGMYAEGQHLGFIPSRHVVKNEAAFAVEELTDAQRQQMVGEFVEQLPKEVVVVTDEAAAMADAATPPPAALDTSTPRYRQGTPEFDSPIDKALYIVANRKRVSPHDKPFVNWLMKATGLSRKQVIAEAQRVKSAMKGLYDGPGSFRVPKQFDETARPRRKTPKTTPKASRVVDAGAPMASRVSPEGSISNRLDRPRHIEAASVAGAGPRVVHVVAPRADPNLFGDTDLFHIVDSSGTTDEVVAAIEVRRPGPDGAAQVSAFYSTVEGGGAGMFGSLGMQKIVQQLGDFYPHLSNMHFADIPLRADGFAEYAVGGEVAEMAQRLNAMPIADDVAEQLDQSFPRASAEDAKYSELLDTGWEALGAKPGTNSINNSISARLTRMYGPGHGGAGTPNDYIALRGEHFPKDPSSPIFELNSWDAYNDLFDTPGALNRFIDAVPPTMQPLFRELGGLWNRAQLERNNPQAWLGHRVEIWKKFEKARMQVNIDAWWAGAKEELGFKEIFKRKIVNWAMNDQGIWRATRVDGYDATKVDADPLHGTLDDLLEDLAKSQADDSYERIYKLTDKQELFLQQGMDVQDYMFRQADELGIEVGEMAEGYWQRIIIKGPKRNDPNVFAQFWDKQIEAPTAGTVKQTYRYERAFATMKEAVAAGYVYDTNPLTRLGARLESGIDSIAHARAMDEIYEMTGPDGRPLMTTRERLLMKKPGLAGESEKFWFANGPRIMANVDETRKAKAAAKRALDANPESPELIDAYREAEANALTAERQMRGQAGPGFYDAVLNGKIGDASLIENIKKYVHIPEIQNSRSGNRPMDGPVGRTVKEVSQMARSLMTNVDLAAAGIQGNILIFRDFESWLTAVAVSLESFVRKPEAYLAKNRAILEEGMSIGAIIRPTEFLFGRTGLSSLPTRIPLAGRAFSSFSRSFEYFIMVGQAELYKVTKARLTNRSLGTTMPTTGGPRNMRERLVSAVTSTGPRRIMDDVPINQTGARQELIDVGKAIRRELGTEDYAILGIRPTQQTFEALTLFAARFMRANVGLIGMAMRGPRSAGSWEARRALAQMLAGATAITTAMHYKQTGRPPNFTDPYAPDWFQVPFGKTYYNMFGPLYPYFRTMARISLAVKEGDPEKALRTAKQFIQSKAALPIRGMGITAEVMATGESRTFEGETIDFSWGGAARGLSEFGAPLAPQGVAKAVADGRHEAIVTEVLGLTGRASPYSQMDILFQNYINDPQNPMAIERQEHKREPGGSYRDASPSEKEYMKEHHEELYLREVESSSGDYGEARREWEVAKGIAIGKEIDLGNRLHNPAHVQGMIGGIEFREEFAKIQTEYWTKLKATNARLGLFEEEIDINDINNPHDKAMYEWTQMYETSQIISPTTGEPTGELDWEQVEDLKEEFEARTPEHILEYIYDNTGLGHSEKGRELVHDRRELRPYWDKRDEIVASLSPQEQQNYAEWQDMTEEQRRMTQAPRYMYTRRKVNKLLSLWLYDESKRGNLRAGYWEEKLVKWGYVTDPITDRGVDLRRKLNSQMGISGEVTFPRYTGAPPPPLPAEGATNDPYADLLP